MLVVLTEYVLLHFKCLFTSVMLQGKIQNIFSPAFSKLISRFRFLAVVPNPLLSIEQLVPNIARYMFCLNLQRWAASGKLQHRPASDSGTIKHSSRTDSRTSPKTRGFYRRRHAGQRAALPHSNACSISKRAQQDRQTS